MTVPRQRVLHFLTSRSAHTMPHLNGTLLDHLLATEELLCSWGSSPELCLAGLCHATYGTDGFAPFLVSWDDRPLLAEVVGVDVEAIVYLYAACDRGVVYPQLAGARPVQFRDRFHRRTFEASGAELRDFADLTLANELDIALGDRGVPGAGAGAPGWIGPLVEQVQPRASPGARQGAMALLGLADCRPGPVRPGGGGRGRVPGRGSAGASAADRAPDY